MTAHQLLTVYYSSVSSKQWLCLQWCRDCSAAVVSSWRKPRKNVVHCVVVFELSFHSWSVAFLGLCSVARHVCETSFVISLFSSYVVFRQVVTNAWAEFWVSSLAEDLPKLSVCWWAHFSLILPGEKNWRALAFASTNFCLYCNICKLQISV